MSENITENRHILNVESGTIQTDILEEMKSKVIINDKSGRSFANNPKKMISKNIQVDFKEELPEGGIVFDLKYEMYWQELAEAKRIELEDALEENERLCKLKETLIKENIHYQKLLEEASSFVEVLKDVVKESPDDTGIDVRDVNDTDDSIDAKESADANDSADAGDFIDGDNFVDAVDYIDANGSIDANGPIDANEAIEANEAIGGGEASATKDSKDE